MDHDHGYPCHQAQDDDPKRKEPQAPEEEPKEPNPPRTPPDVPPLASRMPSLVWNPPPPALQCPGQAERHQNALHPPMVNLPQCPQCDPRAPLRPGNVYGER